MKIFKGTFRTPSMIYYVLNMPLIISLQQFRCMHNHTPKYCKKPARHVISYCCFLHLLTLCNCLSLSSSSASLPHFFWNIDKVTAKKYFKDDQTATTVQLFIIKACARYFHQIFIFSPKDSPSKTMKNAFYFI